MKLLLLLTISLSTLLAAETPAHKTKAQPAAARTAAQAKAQPAIPAGAVQSADGTWRYTDAQGKHWCYRRTPFGISKYEDKPAVPAAEPRTARIKATEDGDQVRFERPGPFGPYRWTRKKTELDATERAAWESQQAAKLE